jgi:L-iditol 2-dehydrogenase
MKAWVLHGIDDLRLEDVEQPHLTENEVLVQVKAVGICGSDIPRIYQTGAHTHPLIPGHEFSGEVVKTGERVSDVWQGKRVGIFPLIPCRECVACKKQQYEMCRNYSYLGSRRDGGFAEYVAVPEWNLLELPKGISFEAAAMLEPMAVATHAIRRVELKNGENIVICGLGTIGLLLLMMLKNVLTDKGFRDKILVVGNKEFQKRQVLSMGIPEENYCDSKIHNVSEWVLAHTNHVGADIFFECVGKNETVLQAIDLSAPSGRICMVGNPYSDMSLDKNVYWKILRNQLTVTGSWNSSFLHEEKDDWNYVINQLEQGNIEPEKLISHRFDMEDLEQGLHIMRDKSEDYVKIMAVIH